MLTKDAMAIAVELTHRRAGAEKQLRGGDFETALRRGHRWFPKLGKTFVACDPDGYSTNTEAVQAAQKFKAECRRAIAKYNSWNS